MTQGEDSNSLRIRRLGTCLKLFTAMIWLAMFVGTHIPGGMQPAVGYNDKLIHFAAYMTLTILVLASWEFSTGTLVGKHYFVVGVLGALYGAFDEITQIPVGRSCDLLDWVANVLGILTGLVLYRVLSPVVFRLLLLRPRLAESQQ